MIKNIIIIVLLVLAALIGYNSYINNHLATDLKELEAKYQRLKFTNDSLEAQNSARRAVIFSLEDSIKVLHTKKNRIQYVYKEQIEFINRANAIEQARIFDQYTAD
jgi:cell division protein FtsB